MHVALFPSTSGRVYRPEEPILSLPSPELRQMVDIFRMAGDAERAA